MENWIISILNQYGYLGIALLITIENLFPPIPSEVILTFGGFMTTFTRMNILGVVLSSTFGSVLGAILLYQLGFFLSPERFSRLINGHIGKLLHFKEEDIQSSISWFNSKGNYTVFFCRFIPIVRSLISIPAGMARMEMGSFLTMTVAGSLIWNFILVTLGAMAGISWQKVVLYMDTYSHVASAVIGVGVLLGILWWIRNKCKKT